MTESFEEHELASANADFILSEDPVAQKLLKEIYSNLKDKPSHDLSIAEHCWLSSIEDLYQDKKSTIGNKVDWYLKIGHELIKEEKELNKEEKAMVQSFKRVLDVSSKNNSLSAFFSELEDSVEALFRLDYFKETKIPDMLDTGENDLLNYIVMTVEMIRERLGQSVVSGKVVRSIMGRISDVGVLVTDEQGRIRFSNDKMTEIVSISSDDIIGSPVKLFLNQENELIHPSANVDPEDFDIQQIKVPSVHGEIDEWVYTFSRKEVTNDLKVERMAEIRTIIEDLSSCDKSDSTRMDVLLEALRTKFARAEAVAIPATGLTKSGSNLRALLKSSLAEIDQEKEAVDVILDAKENIVYFGDDKELKQIIDKMVSFARVNLLTSPRISKLEIVVSSFQHYLLIAFMDNGEISSDVNFIKELREKVEQIQGTLELNSGRMGNNLSIILPI